MLKFFSSPLQPDEFVTKLKSFVDEEEIDPGSRTQFTGERPVIGRFNTHQFTLHRRVGIHWILWWLTPGQWFKPYLTGNVAGDHSGSRVELTGGTPILIKVLWVLALLGRHRIDRHLGGIELSVQHQPRPGSFREQFAGRNCPLKSPGRNSCHFADRWLAANPVSTGRYHQRTAAAPGFEADQLASQRCMRSVSLCLFDPGTPGQTGTLRIPSCLAWSLSFH